MACYPAGAGPTMIRPKSMHGRNRSILLLLRRLAPLLAAAGMFLISVGNEGCLPGAAGQRLTSAPGHPIDDGDPVRPLLRSRELAIGRVMVQPCPIDAASPPAGTFYPAASGFGSVRDRVELLSLPLLRSRLCVWRI